MRVVKYLPVLVCAVLLSTPGHLPAQVNVLTYHYDNTRTGQNTNETLLTPANVNTNTFGKVFSQPVDAHVYAEPLYVSGVTIPGQGTHNILFIESQHNTVYAFDADGTNAGNNGILWTNNLGPYAVTPDPNFGTRYHNNTYQDIVPAVGITGTPVIDRAAGTIYVDAFTHEGTNYFHRIHALNITNGTEQPNSPVVVSATYPGTGYGSSGGVQTFNPTYSLNRAALTLAGGKLFVCYTGYADTDPYHGWILAYDPVTLQRLTNYIFVTTPNSTVAGFGTNAGEGGIWMGGNGLCVDANTNIYLEVANGIFTATTNFSGTEYADSFLKFSITNGLTLLDYFTPYDQSALAAADEDLGSSGCILVPDQTGATPHLVVGSGKSGKVYVVNRDQMTTNNLHYNTNTAGPDFIHQTVTGQVSSSFGTPVYFNGRIYYGGNGDKMKAFTLSGGTLSSTAVSTGTRTFPFPGSTPVVSANGTNNGIVWGLSDGSTTGPAVLVAYNATNLATELYNSSQRGTADQPANGVKYAAPMEANGKVYVGGMGSVTAYGLFAGTLAFASPAYTVSRDGGTATVTVNRIGTKGAVSVSCATALGGTAVDGVDYNSATNALNWSDGDGSVKSFSINILQPNAAESNLTVNLALSTPVGGAGLGGQTTAALTIIQDAYDTWRFTHFGTNAGNPSVAGDLADPDGDGAPNLLEFALASNPTTKNTNALPTAAMVGGNFQLYFPRNTSATNLTYTVLSSPALGASASWNPVITYNPGSTWTPNVAGVTAAESAPSGSVPDQSVNVTINLGAPGASNQFLRLAVHR